MDKSEVISRVEQYAELVAKHINPQEIILFGSFAKGNATDDSDIDVAVIVDSLKEDYLDVAKLLYKLRRDIDDRIEPVLVHGTEDRSGFLTEIKKSGYKVYPVNRFNVQ